MNIPPAQPPLQRTFEEPYLPDSAALVGQPNHCYRPDAAAPVGLRNPNYPGVRNGDQLRALSAVDPSLWPYPRASCQVTFVMEETPNKDLQERQWTEKKC